VYCVSEARKLKIYVRSQKNLLAPNGEVAHVVPRIWVEFIQGGAVPDFARQKALDHFTFNSLPVGLDPMEAIGWFDTDMFAEEKGLSPEDKKFLEDYIRAHDGDGYIICEKPEVTAPWASYDAMRKTQGRRNLEFVIEEIAKTVETIGASPEAVVEYEQQQRVEGWEKVVARMRSVAEELPEVETDPLVAA
jgi:hypothetical protein